jgi:two-component system response regulator CpxR
MAILSIFSASFCGGEKIADALAAKLRWKRIDGDVVSAAARMADSAEKNLVRAMEGPAFVFNKFTHRRERRLALLKSTLSEAVSDRQIVYGFASLLIPAHIGHVLRVCLLADTEWRAIRLSQETGMDHGEAMRKIRAEDLKNAQWVHGLYKTNPWDKTLYDLVVAVNETGEEGAIRLIEKNVRKTVLAYNDSAKDSLEDFKIASRCEAALSGAGHFHAISCKSGSVTIIVDQYVLRLDRLEAEMVSILQSIRGIREIHVMTGPNYRPPSVFTNVDFDLPEKVLLVDDEADFVTTLSERLQMRDIEPAVVYNGEEALHLLEEEIPDVMVLDLRMPGIDGIEVLRKVRSGHPGVAVIILTGHGSEKDRNLCMELGAFAYLEKPVDIEELSDQMRRAKEYIKSRNHS